MPEVPDPTLARSSVSPEQLQRGERLELPKVHRHKLGQPNLLLGRQFDERQADALVGLRVLTAL